MNFTKKTLFAIFFAFIWSCATPVSAAPANDNFSNAVPLQLNGESTNIVTGNAGATKEPGEPNHAENVGGKSVWFSFTPQQTTVIRIRTSEITFDTLLAVYTGSSINNLTLVGYNNDCYWGCSGDSTVDLMVTAGQTYYIAVDSLNDSGTILEGTFKLILFAFDAPPQDNLSNAMNLGISYKGSIAGTNYNATREPNEPNHSNYAGIKTVWYSWKSPADGGMVFELRNNFQSQMAIYTAPTPAPTFAQLTPVTGSSGASGYASSYYRAKFFAEAGKYYFIAVTGLNEQQTPSAGNFQLKFYPLTFRFSAVTSATNDRSALLIFRPSEGIWHRLQDINIPYSSYVRWGKNGDTPVVADFDGDGDSEYAVARNENGVKMWHISDSLGNYLNSYQWGLASDRVAVGDFDRDSRADLVAIRLTPQGFAWYVRQSGNGALRTFYFGTTGDTPVLGDFDGDGFTDVTVVRNTQQGLIWYTLKSGFTSPNMYSQFSATQFGQAPDKFVAEDFDGDGKTDIAVWRPSNGYWYILRSSDGLFDYKSFGQSGDKPQPADFDGDGKADTAVFRPSEGRWYIMKSGNNQLFVINWGIQTDIPVTALSSISQ